MLKLLLRPWEPGNCDLSHAKTVHVVISWDLGVGFAEAQVDTALNSTL